MVDSLSYTLHKVRSDLDRHGLGHDTMKYAPSPDLRQATVVIRFTAGVLALLTALVFAALR